MQNRAARREFRHTIAEAMRKRVTAQLAIARMSGDVDTDWLRDVNKVVLSCNDFGLLQTVYQTLISATKCGTWGFAVMRITNALWPLRLSPGGEWTNDQLRGKAATYVIHDEITLTDHDSHRRSHQAQNSRPPRKLPSTGRTLR